VEENDSNRPFAYADPRSLSQAWYDALYRTTRQKPSAEPQGFSRAALPDERPTSRSQEHSGREAAPQESSFPSPGRGNDASRVGPGGACESDEATLLRTLRRSGASAPRARDVPVRIDADIRDGETALQLLLAQRGARVEVVAVCDPAARERAADALARARIALAGKGIALEHSIRERGEG
jgi:hypothetical protein